MRPGPVFCLMVLFTLASALFSGNCAGNISNPLVDTGQTQCYDNYKAINCPASGASFSGQDAQYQGNLPSYRDNGDGTVLDLVTGLIWSKAVDEAKVSLIEAEKIAEQMTLAGHSD